MRAHLWPDPSPDGAARARGIIPAYGPRRSHRDSPCPPDGRLPAPARKRPAPRQARRGTRLPRSRVRNRPPQEAVPACGGPEHQGSDCEDDAACRAAAGQPVIPHRNVRRVADEPHHPLTLRARRHWDRPSASVRDGAAEYCGGRGGDAKGETVTQHAEARVERVLREREQRSLSTRRFSPPLQRRSHSDASSARSCLLFRLTAIVRGRIDLLCAAPLAPLPPPCLPLLPFRDGRARNRALAGGLRLRRLALRPGRPLARATRHRLVGPRPRRPRPAARAPRVSPAQGRARAGIRRRHSPASLRPPAQLPHPARPRHSPAQLLLLQYNPLCASATEAADAGARFLRLAEEAKVVPPPLPPPEHVLAELPLAGYVVTWDGGERSEAGGLELRVEEEALTVAQDGVRLFTLEAPEMDEVEFHLGADKAATDCTVLVRLAELSTSPSLTHANAVVRLTFGTPVVTGEEFTVLRSTVASWSAKYTFEAKTVSVSALQAALPPAPTAAAAPAPPTPAPSAHAPSASAPPVSPPPPVPPVRRSRLPPSLARAGSASPPPVLSSPPAPVAARSPAAPRRRSPSPPRRKHGSLAPQSRPPHSDASVRHERERSTERRAYSPRRRSSFVEREGGRKRVRLDPDEPRIPREVWDYAGWMNSKIEWNPGIFVWQMALLRALAPDGNFDVPVFTPQEVALLWYEIDLAKLPHLPPDPPEVVTNRFHRCAERLALEHMYYRLTHLGVRTTRLVLLTDEYPALRTYAEILGKIIDARDALPAAYGAVFERVVRLRIERDKPGSRELGLLLERLRDNPLYRQARLGTSRYHFVRYNDFTPAELGTQAHERFTRAMEEIVAFEDEVLEAAKGWRVGRYDNNG